MAWRSEEEARDAEVGALFLLLRQDEVQTALDAIEADTGLPRERVIAEAVVYAGKDRRAFLAHLRGRPSDQCDGGKTSARESRFFPEIMIEVLVGGMFLLGVALAAIQIWLR